jgi:hypothetical protein
MRGVVLAETLGNEALPPPGCNIRERTMRKGEGAGEEQRSTSKKASLRYKGGVQFAKVWYERDRSVQYKGECNLTAGECSREDRGGGEA